MTDPGAPEHITTNVAMSTTLTDILMDAGLRRFVFVSTVNEYGGREGLLVEDMPPVGRMTNYAKGKAMVTAHGLQHPRQGNQSFLSVRLFYTYGPGQRDGALLNTLLDCRRRGVTPRLGPCEHYRDYVYVGDAAEGISRLCVNDFTGIVNLGSGSAIQVRDFVSRFWMQLGGELSSLCFGALPMRTGEPEQPRSYASLERLNQLIGWAPRTSLADGFRKTTEGGRESSAKLIDSTSGR
jgi:nucleoside-diphosphate-sugar epimerase